MTSEYVNNSASQQSIGRVTIDALVQEIGTKISSEGVDRGKLRGLDIACGPGNLTIELRDVLQANFPGNALELSGLDYTEENVKRLLEASRESVGGIVGSFFDMQADPASVDFVFSNEGLHWQPPYEMDEIIYTHLPDEQRAEYERQALANFEAAIANIFNYLDEDGVAVVQFGHAGQLRKLWDLLKQVFDEEAFCKAKKNFTMPLFYPTEAQIKEAFRKAGFQDSHFDISAFNQDLVEDSPEKILGFFRAFSESGLQACMSDSKVEAFYQVLGEKLEQMDVAEFRKDQWHRTLVRARK